MITSMTGYASGQGALDGYRWSWDMRSVNGKGLDLRLRVPDWIDGLEAGLRAILIPHVARGNVSVALRVQRDDSAGQLQLNETQLETILKAMEQTEARAMDRGLSLAPSTAADILAQRGVLEPASEDSDTGPLRAALEAEFAQLVGNFAEMRNREGAALMTVLTDQLTEIAALTEQAAGILATRKDDINANFRRNMAKILESTDAVDENRLAQELAVLAVKSDVTEEIDRLRAHVTAACDLLESGGPVGRKLDFLCQEFNREANTLCSKAQMSALTEIGLALKVLIDQMREQIQNVE